MISEIIFPVIGFFGISFLFFFILLIIIVSNIIWFAALFDLLISKRQTDEKLIWVFIILFFHLFGAAAYFVLVRIMKKNILALSEHEKKTQAEPGLKNKIEKKLYRSKHDRVIAGVCGGLGEYFNMDPVIIRLLLVLVFFMGGSGFLAYIIAWILIPEEP